MKTQLSHFNIPHTHNQPIQHISKEKTSHNTTKQQKKSPNQKNNPADNQKEVAQKTPTTTQRTPDKTVVNNLKSPKRITTLNL